MGKFFKEPDGTFYGWVDPNGNFTSCSQLQHYYLLPPKYLEDIDWYTEAYDKAQKDGWVRVSSYRNKFDELIMVVFGEEEFFQELEMAILTVAYSKAVLTTEWKAME